MAKKEWNTQEVAKKVDIEYEEPMSSDEVQKLHRALPGYQAVVDDVCELIQKHGNTLALDDNVLTDMEEGLSRVKELEPLERALEKVYQSVYHMRLKATAQCMDGLYQTSRRVREFSNAYPNIKEDAQFLLDFMKAFRPGPKAKEKDES